MAVTADTPVRCERADDVQAVPVATAWIKDGREPWAAVVFDFDPGIAPGNDLGADGEFAAGSAGVAVQDGVGGQF